MRLKFAVSGALGAALLGLGCAGDAPSSPNGASRLSRTSRPAAAPVAAPEPAADSSTRTFVLQAGQWADWALPARQLRRFVQYRSSDPSVAFAGSDGRIQALSAGEAEITRNIADQVERARVTVLPAPETQPLVAAVELLPKTGAELMAGAGRQFSAVARDSSGAVVEVPLTFRATGGQVTPMGYYTAGQLSGTFMVIASCVCGLADTATVQVAQTQQASSLVELRIAPKEATVQPDGVVQFTTSARWRNGSTAVPPLTYTASGGTVTVAGLYTAPSAAGTYRVIVAPDSGAIRDTAVVTVSLAPAPSPEAPAPPPPTPPGQAFFEDDFDNGARNDANGFTWARTSQVTVSTERAFSGEYALRFRFGPNAPGADAMAEQRFDIGRYMSELAVEFMLYVPANFKHRDDRPTNNKLFMLWRDVYSDVVGGTWQFGAEMLRSSDSLSKARVLARRWDFNHVSDNGPWPAGTPTTNPPLIGGDAPLRVGVWNRVRFYAKAASARGASDGVLMFWVNEELVFGTSTGRFFNYYANPDDTVLRKGYLMGWSNSGYEELTVFYIDDFRVFAGNPGW